MSSRKLVSDALKLNKFRGKSKKNIDEESIGMMDTFHIKKPISTDAAIQCCPRNIQSALNRARN